MSEIFDMATTTPPVFKTRRNSYFPLAEAVTEALTPFSPRDKTSESEYRSTPSTPSHGLKIEEPLPRCPSDIRRLKAQPSPSVISTSPSNASPLPLVPGALSQDFRLEREISRRLTESKPEEISLLGVQEIAQVRKSSSSSSFSMSSAPEPEPEAPTYMPEIPKRDTLLTRLQVSQSQPRLHLQGKRQEGRLYCTKRLFRQTT